MPPSIEPNSYIVLLKEDCEADTHRHLEWLHEQAGGFGAESDESPHVEINHEYESVKGYAAILSDSALETVKSNGDVELIVQDAIMEAYSETSTAAGPLGGRVHNMETQGEAPWGLERLSFQPPLPSGSSPTDLTYKYRWGQGLTETPVDVYVLDTGVRVDHDEFKGRARWGKTFGGYGDDDKHGHGTHVAGTVAGTRFGVAKNANIIAVKVLADDGFGRTRDIMAGIDWAEKSARDSGRASIINMSLGGDGHRGIDLAATRAYRRGVHVVAASGNSSKDASNESPARAQGVITVGSTNIKDEMRFNSNYGKVVSIFAPGEDIISAGIDSPTAQAKKSGTSMAAPYVAGVLAWWISISENRSPDEFRNQLLETSLVDRLSKVPSGTVNRLLNNGL